MLDIVFSVQFKSPHAHHVRKISIYATPQLENRKYAYRVV